MAKKERLQLTFSMSSPLQRQAWELLCAIPKGERTREICRALCQLDNLDLILDNVRNTVRDELQNGNFVPAEKAARQEDTKGTEGTEEPENVKIADGYMAFLSSLDDDDDDDDESGGA